MSGEDTREALVAAESLAVEQAGYSPCQSKRGVVIFRVVDGVVHVIARGQNHKPDGFPCDGSAACKATCRTEAVHAEQMALLNAGRDAEGCEVLHVKAVDGKAVPSGPPSCVQCSKLLMQARVAGVWLLHEDGWQRYETTEFHRLSLREAADVASRLAALQEAIALRDAVIREHAEAASIFQPGGKRHEQARLRLGASAVVEGIKWLDTELSAREAASRLAAPVVTQDVLDGVTVAGARAFSALQDLERRHESLRAAVMTTISDPNLTWEQARTTLGRALAAEVPHAD